MAIKLTVGDDAIDLVITGWYDRVMCVSSGAHIPLADVVGARLVTWDEARADMGWRVGGAYWPGSIATGWYTMPGQKGLRQLWAVFKDRAELLMIDTRLDKPCRLVLADPDRARLAAAINERVPAAPPSEPGT